MHDAANSAWSPDAKWIRIISEKRHGLIEFEFAVGEPGLYVEMIMARAEFDDFCQMHQLVPTLGPLPERTNVDAADDGSFDWNLREARTQHFRSSS